MGKDLFIAEKPSVAREFAKALKYNMSNRDGYMESEQAIVTWCVGHLVTMSYPDVYKRQDKGQPDIYLHRAEYNRNGSAKDHFK